jgi:hypothetical protein
VNAASESMNSTSTVVVQATITVLNIEPKKSMLPSNREMLSIRWLPGVSFGGYR